MNTISTKKFNALSEINRITRFIKKFFSDRPQINGAIIGISGGKDSTVAAALCVKALGPDFVHGLLLPAGAQADIHDSYKVCELLEIKYAEINIKKAVDELESAVLQVTNSNPPPYAVPPRIRMTCLYAAAAVKGLLVTCTSNLSELTVGYATKWGDNVGDFAPIAHLTKSEVVKVGLALGLPEALINKTPTDGLTGKNDEQNFGFTYEELDKYIKGGKVSAEVKAKIEKRIGQNKHKTFAVRSL